MWEMVVAASPRYEVVCRLAGGGMADLYLARSVGPAGFERLVVVKRLAPQLATDPKAMQDLFDEARIAATLSHANIVQVTDVEVTNGQVSIVMEFLHGHDVSHLLRRLTREAEVLPLDHAVAIALGVCAGLHHAHERVDADGRSLEIVHRDISPHNVFVTYDGAVKLIDFGIARAASRKGKTEQGLIKGKPGYIAPEVLRGRKIDRRTDVWGVAVLLFEMTTGATPFGESVNLDELVAVATQDPPRPSSRVAGYIPELEAIVLRGLAREPDARYPTAEAMRLELEGFARARGLDLSPFRIAALMERVFAENIGAWRQAQRHGRSLADHVTAFRASGAHDIPVLPGDPTEVGMQAAPPRASWGDIDGPTLDGPTIEGPTVPAVRKTPFPGDTLLSEPPVHAPRRRAWRKVVAIAVGFPIVVITGLVVWSAVSSTKHSVVIARDAAVSVAPMVAAPPDAKITVVPIEPTVPTGPTIDPTTGPTPVPTVPEPDVAPAPPPKKHPSPKKPHHPSSTPTTTTPPTPPSPTVPLDPDAPLP